MRRRNLARLWGEEVKLTLGTKPIGAVSRIGTAAAPGVNSSVAIRKFAGADGGLGANFRISSHTSKPTTLMCFLNLKFAPSPTDNQANFKFGTLVAAR